MLTDHPILNPGLVAALAGAGHTDLVVIADAGLPLPPGVPVIDLSVIAGLPSVAAVGEVVVRSLAVEAAVIATEAADGPAAGILAGVLGGLTPTSVPHEDLKRLTATARTIIRTGECTPYTNLVLRCGTTF